MGEYFKEALEIVKAQAGVRVMTEEEMLGMLGTLSESLRKLDDGETPMQEPAVDPKTAIKENTIINLEDGKTYKVLTKRTLAKFGLTPEEYREKWGYPKRMPLVCKKLQRERRKKMKEMQLWKKRGKKK